MPSHLLIPVTDNSSIGEVRRAVLTQCESAKLDQTDAGRAAIVATELATNLVRHATPGARSIILTADPIASLGFIQITAIDAGPGIADLARCMEDGYSTAGTPGNGLGAIRRLSDQFDFFSTSAGTLFWTAIHAGGTTQKSPPTTPAAAAVSLPIHGETLCGDAWRITRADDGRIALMIADGLGHGPLAAEASEAACKVFDQTPFADPAAMLAAMHVALTATRGAAIAIARIDPAAGKISYAGIGNISGTLIDPHGESRGLFSHNGTVGHIVRKAQVFEYPYSSADILVLHSDGLQSRWSMDKYPGLRHRHAAVIAGVLFRDFRRGRDDATVLTVSPSKTTS
jgi:anti-sigma regulatory factor (Ser/Thr protein kinase)